MVRRTTRRPRHAPPGFTLLETCMALIIIGVGVLAFVEAQRTFTQNNQWSSHTSRAMYVASEIRELCRRLPRHDPVTGLYLDTSSGTPVLRGWGMETGEASPEDFDDIDDLDGATFGGDGDFAGPIDSYGQLIHDTDASGQEILDEDGNPIGLSGWSQTVTVEKVDPFNFATVRDHDFKEDASGSFPGRPVDKYPLRITVSISYRGPFDSEARQVTSVSWIAP